MTLRTGRSPRGFTLLELLLVLVVLSLFAAMAIPRLSGAVDQLGWDKQKRQILDFLRHCERLARIEGEPLVLIWNGERHALLLYQFQAVQSPALATGMAWQESSGHLRDGVSAEDFLEFVERLDAEGVMSSSRFIDAAVEEPVSVRQAKFRWMEGLIEKLPVDTQLDVDVRGLPLVFHPTGIEGKGEIRLQRDDGDESRLAIRGFQELVWDES